MARVTISIDDDLLETFDVFIGEKGYETRSEGIRDAIRHLLAHEEVAQRKDAPCVGCVTYVYSHRERTLSSRLMETQHHHHEIPAATLHVHIDPETCLETTVLRGTVAEVEDLADRITSQTGVRNGRLHVIPIEKTKHEKHET